MAKTQITTHSKYDGVIVSKFTMRKVRDDLKIHIDDITEHLVSQLSYIGEAAVKIARENGTYNDITGNLRSSIGYVVLVDGKQRSVGPKKQYKGKKGAGAQGPPAATALMNKLTSTFPYGVVLIVCAGMNYAAYVESVHKKDVLTSAELEAERLLKSLLKGFTKD